tara:strand:+ start:3150 stop:3800 length:651 start_codon:yes stop_codon:yes gene_type:complete
VEINLTISIDDLHPEKGWGCEGDECVSYLEKLNEEFGCKFTLFIPSNYHRKYPLSKHKDWVELAAHGHYHQCERDGIGECEFFELDTEEKALQRISDCLSEWDKVGLKPKGWRNPGWLAHSDSVKVLGKYFEYSAIHQEHNHGLVWDCKTFEGEDGIHKTDSISIWNGNVFMFQSHIAGDWNDNVWNKENYENFRNVLEYLQKSYKLDYKTIGELV